METNLREEKNKTEYFIEDKNDGINVESINSTTENDEIEFPTEEELLTLPRIAGKIPYAAYLIAFIELVERFSYYGATAVFTNFIQQPLPIDGNGTGAGHLGQSGALGLGQSASAGLGTFNSFFVYLTPIAGAVVADQYLGRYKTICYAVGISLIGHALLIGSAAPSLLQENPKGALALFIIAIIISGCGTGAIKSNIAPLIAEQQLEGSKKLVIRIKNGSRFIEDPALTLSRIFLGFYFLINIGALSGQIGMVFAEKNEGFYLAFLIPTAVFCLCPFVLWYGNKKYFKSPPNGSVLLTSYRVWNYSFKNRKQSKGGEDFWEIAKPSNIPIMEERPKWMTYDDAFVEEVKRGLKACTVFLWYPLYWITYNQINNNLVSQAAVLNTHGLPNDVISNLDPLALVILIPIFDQFIYPFLAKNSIRFTPIKRIALGFITGSLAMISAAVVQEHIYKTSACGYFASTCPEQPFIDLTVWIQIPAYLLIAISEIFASITGLEYAYSKAPASMKSVVMSIYLLMNAFGSAIGFAFVPASSDPHLTLQYAIVAGLSGGAGIIFWFQFRSLDSQEDALNSIDVGKL